MRFKGMLKSWNDERGFGFLEPLQGGEDVFVHIRAFRVRNEQPQIGQVMVFEVEFGPQGKKRAKNVEPTRTSKPRTRKWYVRPGTATLIAIPLFLVLYVVVSVLWDPPLFIAAVYVGASFVTFFVYARDKLAAKRNDWRTTERTLHLLALAGGWPGALLAQQYLRHKSTKAEFRSKFWGTVVLNVVIFFVLCSQVGPTVWAIQ